MITLSVLSIRRQPSRVKQYDEQLTLTKSEKVMAMEGAHQPIDCKLLEMDIINAFMEVERRLHDGRDCMKRKRMYVRKEMRKKSSGQSSKHQCSD